jgi:hypothetical protein
MTDVSFPQFTEENEGGDMGARPEALPTLESIASYVKKNVPAAKAAMKMHHGDPGGVESEEYNGHQIVIRTTYHIEVDGTTLMGHLSVDSDGHVESHALPNYEFTTPMNFVKKLIDEFPQDFTGQGGHGHGGHGHSGMTMAGMKAMKPKSKSKAKTKAKKVSKPTKRTARKRR